MRKRVVLFVSMLTLACTSAYGESQPTWTQLSLSTCQVDKFLADNPNSDGRGVVIAILDTGVDPSIPGLTKTPDGEVKTIDLQDFTGQGDVELLRVRLDPETGKLVDYDDEGSPILYELPPLPDESTDRERRYWMGVLDERRFVNSDEPDLNDNGELEDEWAVLVVACAGDGDDDAVCYVDTNMNRGFADEKPLRSYKVNYDTLDLHRDKPEQQIIPMTFGINIFLREAKVVFCWDDGAHGTHVAGIAAGYRINNQDGFNGVAPGAKLMGLKIGKNSIGGVSVTNSIKDALEYAGRYAREHDVPVVCNLSFGVESEIEGHSDIDEWVDEFLRTNPYVTFCTSAGNEGPGLSSVGTPAASYHVLSIGALMAADTGRDVAGYRLDDAVITTFSSRGGEVAKPNFVVPGWSTSTVPRYNSGGDFWAGTSMASPYAAGLCALLASDALAADSKVKVRAWDLRRALSLSARPVKDATPLDMGWGVPVLPEAKKILDKLIPAAKDDPVVGYNISTACPQGYKGAARAAYWRSTWFPAEDRQTFTIRPIFGPTADAAAMTSFTRKFQLRSNADWIKPPQQSTYLRGKQSARVYVEYDAAKLKKPGLYVGTVDALHDGLVAFRLTSTIVVPHRFNTENNHRLVFENQTVDGWTPNRYFFAVPPGASAMKLTLSAPEEKKSRTRFEYVFDPAGHGHRVRSARLDTDGGRREIVRTFTDDLAPGVWEVPIIADKPDKQWPYELRAQFFGIHANPPVITDWSGGGKPSGEMTVTNMFETRVAATADGMVEGYRKHEEDSFEGLEDVLEYSVKLDERFDRVRVHLEMTPEDYATTTDIGVMVKDSSGEAIYSSAFDNRVHDATIRASGSVTVVITGGFAVSDDERETPIEVNIDRLLADPIAIKVSRNGAANLNLVPGMPIPLEFDVQKRLKDQPKGAKPVGYLRFRERHSNDEVLRAPIEIEG